MIRSDRLKAYIIKDPTDFIGWVIVDDPRETNVRLESDEPVYLVELERDIDPKIRRVAYVPVTLLPKKVTHYVWRKRYGE